MKEKKIDRNALCPCGSGLKYKKCHGRGKPTLPMKSETVDQTLFVNLPSRVQQQIIDQEIKTKKRKAQYGEVRPTISVDFHGYKMIAVGNRMHYSQKWKTFHDFLFYYIKNCLGAEWGKSELNKETSEVHPLLQWYKKVCEFQKKHFSEDGEVSSAVCTGIVGSYLALAYNLYVLRHHSKLQEKLLQRLKNKDQFQGALYEVYVAASFIKAGFDIEFEDEDDRSKTHCEFTAMHKKTKKKYSVEAKSRHRTGFLGQKGEKLNAEEIKLRIGKLLNNALKKHANHERIVFLDVNMPPSEEKLFKVNWFNPLVKIIGKVEKDQIADGKEVPAYLFFTNHPAHYAGDDKVDPSRNFYFSAINITDFKENKPELIPKKYPILLELWSSINNHGSVPHELDS